MARLCSFLGLRGLVAGLPVQDKKVKKKKTPKDITQGARANTLSPNTGVPVIQSLQEVGAEARTRPPSDGVTQHEALQGEGWKTVSRGLGRGFGLVSFPTPNTLRLRPSSVSIQAEAPREE